MGLVTYGNKTQEMYIRMLNFQTSENKKPELLGIMDGMIPRIKSLRGCTDCKFIMHEADNLYALLVFWETKESADAAAGIIGPDMIPAFNKIALKPVNPLLYEVYQGH